MENTAISSPAPFDRLALRRNRERAARGDGGSEFLFREAAQRLVERLDEVTREFPVALELGCRRGFIAEALQGKGGIATLIQSDLSEAMVKLAAGGAGEASEAGDKDKAPETFHLVSDEEFLPFADNSVDLVISCLSLHWVNDLPGALIQIRRILRPDGLFLGCLFGAETLNELRSALTRSQSQVEGGVSPRVSPFVDVRDAGGLLQRAGFALPMVDADTLDVRYKDPGALLKDLRAMGETNILNGRHKGLSRRATLDEAMRAYADMFTDKEGRIAATFRLITLTGWCPDASQSKPLAPGSATTPLAAALDTVENPDTYPDGEERS